MGKAASAVGGALQKGVTSVKKAVGQIPPTVPEARAYLSKKGIDIRTVDRLMDLKVLPHTRMGADALGYNYKANRERWEETLDNAGVNRTERGDIMMKVLGKDPDIAVWMPFMNADSFR
jgi:hypothetical protein